MCYPCFYMARIAYPVVPDALREAYEKTFYSNGLKNSLSLKTSRRVREPSRLAVLNGKSLFNIFEPIWDTFTSARRAGWHLFWGGWPGSGYSAFVEINAPRYKANLDLILDAPTFQAIHDPDIGIPPNDWSPSDSVDRCGPALRNVNGYLEYGGDYYDSLPDGGYYFFGQADWPASLSGRWFQFRLDFTPLIGAGIMVSSTPDYVPFPKNDKQTSAAHFGRAGVPTVVSFPLFVPYDSNLDFWNPTIIPIGNALISSACPTTTMKVYGLKAFLLPE